MCRLLLGLMVALGISAFASEARAQNNFNDPFFAYYSYYLPQQAALATRPTPELTLNAIASNRQLYAATGRNGMFDPNSAAGFDPSDSGEFGFNPGTGRRRSASNASGKYGVHGGNLNGLGAQGYFNRDINRYFPGSRTGRGRNANVAVTRGRGFSAGGYGGMGGGLPGPR